MHVFELYGRKLMEEFLMAEKKCTIVLFYHGGTKARASLTMDRTQVEEEMKQARMNNREAKLECFEEDKDGKPTGEESYLYVARNELLMYNITIPQVQGLIAVVPSMGIMK